MEKTFVLLLSWKWYSLQAKYISFKYYTIAVPKSISLGMIWQKNMILPHYKGGGSPL